MKSLTIGRVADAVGVSVETVRYYEREALLAEPGRTHSRYRQYGEEAIHRLRFILRAKEHGFTLREIKVILDIHDSHTATKADVREVIEEKIASVETQIRQLQEYEGALERLRSLCEGDGPASECPILKALSGALGDGADERTEDLPNTDLPPERWQA